MFCFLLRDLNLQFEGLVKAVIFCDVPEQFKSMVHAFYSQAFQAYQLINKKESGKMDTSGTAKNTVLVTGMVPCYTFGSIFSCTLKPVAAGENHHLTHIWGRLAALARSHMNQWLTTQQDQCP